MGNVPRWRAKWPAISRRGSQNGRKVAGQIAGQLKFGDFLPIRPFGNARPFFGHFGTPPPPREMAAGHFVGHFSAIFGSGPVSHSVAGQPSLNNRPSLTFGVHAHQGLGVSTIEWESTVNGNHYEIHQIPSVGASAERKCPQNKFETDKKNGLKNAKKDPQKRSETCPKMFSPSHVA